MRNTLWLLLFVAFSGLPPPALAATCVFQWDPSVTEGVTLAGYRLYSRMTQDIPYDADMPTEDILVDELADPNAPEWVAVCEAGQYWVATAYDIDNVSSVFSNEVQVVQSADTTAPVVIILSPTSNPTWTTNKNRLPVKGTAQDAGGVTVVHWRTSAGQNGVASGTTSWSTNVPVPKGTTAITIEALDPAGNIGSDVLSVTR